MLARRREQILIIVGLIGLNILLGWFMGRLWKDYRSRTQWLYAGASAQPPATRAAGSNQAGQPQSFVEIVDRNVFSPLRGNRPPQPQEEAKAPKLPLLFGTMNLGNGRFALMAPGDQPSSVSKRVLPGEEIGGYKLVSIGTSNVVLEWQEKKITLDISESARRAPGNVEKTANASLRSAPGSTAGSAPTPVMTVGPASGECGVRRCRPSGAARGLSRRPARHCRRRKAKGCGAHSFRRAGPVAGRRPVRLTGAATNRWSQQVRRGATSRQESEVRSQKKNLPSPSDS